MILYFRTGVQIPSAPPVKNTVELYVQYIDKFQFRKELIFFNLTKELSERIDKMVTILSNN